MKRLKFLLQRVVDPLIVGDDHGVTSHRAVILKTKIIHHYPFHFQKENERNIQGLGKNIITYCDCMSRELEYLETWADVWRRFEWKKTASPGWSSTKTSG